jgi:hypothetical protein
MFLEIAIFAVCFLVFVIGMVGLNRYPDSKHKSKVSRLVFSSVVGFALGLAPVMFIIGTAVGPLNDPVSLRIFMGLMSIICLLAWILCAVLLSDRSEIDLGKKTTQFVATMLPILILGWLGFSFSAYTGLGTYTGVPRLGFGSLRRLAAFN